MDSANTITKIVIGFLLFQGLLGSLVAQGELSKDDSVVVFDWKVAAVVDGAGESLITPSYDDVLQIKADGTFVYGIKKDTISEAGKWIRRNDSLILQYELIPITSGIDSVAYLAQGDVPLLLFFNSGKEVARQTVAGLESKRREEGFRIELLDNTNLVLHGASREIQLTGRAPMAVKSFSFMDVIRGMFGVVFLLFIAWLFSTNRKAINWQLVGTGIFLQLVFAILVLKVPFVNMGFEAFAGFFVKLLDFTRAGSVFMFGGLVGDLDSFGYIFAFQVLPTIVFFSALTSLLYYLGILQKIVYGFAWVMSKTMRLSGAESLAAAGNIFLGQTEAPLLVKPYLEKMTKSEILCLMSGGMATIAGGVFAAYIGYLGGTDPVQQQIFATHLLTASIMSAPAAIVAAKMLLPETETINREITIAKEKLGSNVLDAISSGTIEGLKLAVNVGVMLLVFIAMIDMCNYFFGDVIGHYTGLNAYIEGQTDGRYSEFNLQLIFGFIFSPIAYLLGVPTEDMLVVGQLLGEKTIINEFVAYTSLGQAKSTGLIHNYKSLIIATYALCGFANFASIGIQIGGIGALAPNQWKTLSKLGVRALLGGTIAAFLTAVFAGMLSGL